MLVKVKASRQTNYHNLALCVYMLMKTGQENVGLGVLLCDNGASFLNVHTVEWCGINLLEAPENLK